ncbi:MAG: phage integrase family protein, partial [Mesorhizobium sp.]
MHIEELLGRFIATPHKAKHLLVGIRKLVYVALRQDWIEIDPTAAVEWRILDAADRRGETVLVNGYGEPFSAKSLTGMMTHWCKLAGLPKGLTLHGLRKSLGVYLAEAEASTRQLMDVLGHDDIDHA